MKSMNCESGILARKICLDAFILFCVSFPILGFWLWLEPYHRGYFRDDTTLMLPFKGSTISTALIISVGFILNVFTILAVELARGRRTILLGSTRFFGLNIPAWLSESCQIIEVFTFGAACQHLTTSVGKYTIGRLRPHFFSICNPLVDHDVPAGQVYVERYTCQGIDAYLLKEMRLSFPSAHSSFAAYACLFFALYMQARFKWGSKLLLHGMQFAAVLFGWYTGLSRVTDHKHHWSDVAAGFLIGALYGVLVFFYVSHIGTSMRRLRRNKDEDLDNSYRAGAPYQINLGMRHGQA